MPHLLIAGSTGTGKSVGLNAMLTGILYRATPDDVRMIMVDPKRLELGMYEDIPHLMTPVVVEPKKAANALRWAVREMEERYKTLAAVRRPQHRAVQPQRAGDARGRRPPTRTANRTRPLPFIVVVVDELADLMMVAGNEVEESICRLAQMARAVGIHLILATQRPSVDVITGLIKANLPSRISFRVSSKIDSRTILDSNGAEQLLGKGDMLFLPPASSRHIRLHGPVHLRAGDRRGWQASCASRASPSTTRRSPRKTRRAAAEGLEFEKDELYDEAARIVVQTGQASISYLQRKMRIGFSRAARLVDMMEAEGLVSGRPAANPARCSLDASTSRKWMRSFGKRHARASWTAIAAWLLVCDLAAQSAKPQTAKERFEAAQQRDEQVRVLLTDLPNAPPPADVVTQVKQVDDVIRIGRAPVPDQRLCGQRAVAGGEPGRCGISASSTGPRIATARCGSIAGWSRNIPRARSSSRRNAKIESLAAVAARCARCPRSRPRADPRHLPATATPVSLPAPVAPRRAVGQTARRSLRFSESCCRGRCASPSNSIRKWPIARNGSPVRRGCSST